MRPSMPSYNKRSIRDALDRATSQLVRAHYQFTIPGPRQRDHWARAIDHLTAAHAALDDAEAVLGMLYVALYGPRG